AAGVALGAEQAAAADSGLKAMIPIGRPFLDYVISALADAGFTDVCLVVAPDHDAIRDHYTRAAPPTRVHVAFAVQSAPIGTADAVLATQAFTRGEPFVVLNADNYYPAEVLRRLRLTNGAAAVGFTRDGLLRGGNVPAERLASGMPVSMNVWRLTSEFFQACRDVQPSPRGELELPLAVQYAIDVLGMQ